jgi:hypothetical protein
LPALALELVFCHHLAMPCFDQPCWILIRRFTSNP